MSSGNQYHWLSTWWSHTCCCLPVHGLYDVAWVVMVCPHHVRPPVPSGCHLPCHSVMWCELWWAVLMIWDHLWHLGAISRHSVMWHELWWHVLIMWDHLWHLGAISLSQCDVAWVVMACPHHVRPPVPSGCHLPVTVWCGVSCDGLSSSCETTCAIWVPSPLSQCDVVWVVMGCPHHVRPPVPSGCHLPVTVWCGMSCDGMSSSCETTCAIWVPSPCHSVMWCELWWAVLIMWDHLCHLGAISPVTVWCGVSCDGMSSSCETTCAIWVPSPCHSVMWCELWWAVLIMWDHLCHLGAISPVTVWCGVSCDGLSSSCETTCAIWVPSPLSQCDVVWVVMGCPHHVRPPVPSRCHLPCHSVMWCELWWAVLIMWDHLCHLGAISPVTVWCGVSCDGLSSSCETTCAIWVPSPLSQCDVLWIVMASPHHVRPPVPSGCHLPVTVWCGVSCDGLSSSCETTCAIWVPSPLSQCDVVWVVMGCPHHVRPPVPPGCHLPVTVWCGVSCDGLSSSCETTCAIWVPSPLSQCDVVWVVMGCPHHVRPPVPSGCHLSCHSVMWRELWRCVLIMWDHLCHLGAISPVTVWCGVSCDGLSSWYETTCAI